MNGARTEFMGIPGELKKIKGRKSFLNEMNFAQEMKKIWTPVFIF